MGTILNLNRAGENVLDATRHRQIARTNQADAAGKGMIAAVEVEELVRVAGHIDAQRSGFRRHVPVERHCRRVIATRELDGNALLGFDRPLPKTAATPHFKCRRTLALHRPRRIRGHAAPELPGLAVGNRQRVFRRSVERHVIGLLRNAKLNEMPGICKTRMEKHKGRRLVRQGVAIEVNDASALASPGLGTDAETPGSSDCRRSDQLELVDEIVVVACVGGGSNSIGMFIPFLKKNFCKQKSILLMNLVVLSNPECHWKAENIPSQA